MTELTYRQKLEKLGGELQQEIYDFQAKADAAAVLKQRIEVLSQYDSAIQKMISVHPDLADEWKAFEALFETVTGTQLLRTADEKIAGKRGDTCVACGRKTNK